jgi:plastocyanin
VKPAGRLFAAGVFAVLAGAASIAASAPPPPKVYTVVIRDMAFGPLPARLRVGDTVEWVNNDIFQHSATATDKSFDADLAPKAHGRTVMRKAGVIAFYCRYHPGMKGRLTVVK